MSLSDSFLWTTFIGFIAFVYSFSPIPLPYLRNLRKEPHSRGAVAAAPASRSPQEVHIFTLLNISTTPNSVECAGYVQSPKHCRRDIADPPDSELRAFAEELSKRNIGNWSRDDVEHLAGLVLCDKHIRDEELKKKLVGKWESIKNAAAVLFQTRGRQEKDVEAAESKQREGSEGATLVNADEEDLEQKYKELEENLARLAKEHNRLRKDGDKAKEDAAHLPYFKNALKTANREIAEKVEVADQLKVVNERLRIELASRANENMEIEGRQGKEPPLAYWRNALKTSNHELAEKDEVLNQLKITNDSLRNELAALADQRDSVERLTATNKRLKQELDEQANQYVSKEKELSDAKIVLQDLTAKTAELDAAKRTLTEHGSVLKKSNTEHVNLKSELSRLMDQYADAQKEIENARKKVQELESAHQMINEELASAKHDHESAYKSLKKEVSKAKIETHGREEQMKKEIQERDSVCARLQVELEASKRTVAEKQSKVEQLESEKKDIESRQTSLKEELDSHKRNLSSAESRIQSLEREKAKAQEDAETAMSKLQTISQEQTATLQSELKSIQEELETTGRTTQEQRWKIEQLERESENSKAQAQRVMNKLEEQTKEEKSKRDSDGDRPRSKRSFSLRDSWGRMRH